MKVAFQGTLAFGGVGTVTRELTRRISRYADVTIFDVNRFPNSSMSNREASTLNIYTRSFPLGAPLNLLRHGMAFRTFDLAHINYGLFGLSAVISRRFSKTPYIETVHGIPQPKIEKGYDRLGYLAEQWSLPLTAGNASLLVSDSEYIRSGLKSQFGIDSVVVPLGVDLVRFRPPTNEEALAVRHSLNIGDGELVILFTGRLHPWKDPMTLVRAVQLLLREFRNARLILAGKGILEQSILRLAESLKIRDKVTIVTDVDYYHGLSDYYVASDIFVLPTNKEGFGLVLLEAMASGLPVVASDGGASPEVIDNAGILFRTGDPYSLARVLIELASNPSLRKDLGRGARERAARFFDWERCSNYYLEAYSRIIDGQT